MEENILKKQKQIDCLHLTSMDDFAAVNAKYAKVFAGNFPAHSCVAVQQLFMGGLVEVEAIVVL